MSWRRFPLFLTVLLASIANAAVPAYTPQRDGEIVEALPSQRDPALREIQALRRMLARNRNDAPLTLQLAQRYIELSRRDADPRYSGQAEALLAPWIGRPDVAAPLRVMWAIVLQGSHRFDEAIAQLQIALQQDPTDPQAWTSLASIRLVRGELEAARRACTQLAVHLDPGAAIACMAGIDALGPQAERAYALLARRATNGEAAEWEVPGLHVQLAELAQRLGRSADAERHFSAALRSAPEAYTRAAWADFLLDQGRATEVLQALDAYTRADPLLLRLAEAAFQAGDRRAADWVEELEARFAAARARGERSHQREEARFALHLRHDAPRALALAQANWSVQHEIADARVLLEAALAARQPRAAAPVLTWLRQTGLRDPGLAALQNRLEAKS